MFAFCFQIQGKIIIIYDPVNILYVLKLLNKGKNGKFLNENVVVLKNDDLTAFFIFRWHVKVKVNNYFITYWSNYIQRREMKNINGYRM